MFEGKSGSLGGAIAAALLGMAAPAWAAPLLPNIAPFGDHTAFDPPVARYITVQGQAFVLDRVSAAQVLLKFDSSPEVWALEASPAPGGAILFRNDAGETVLRQTRLGGLTLFTEQEPAGMPVAAIGEADALLPPSPLPQGVLLQRIIQDEVRVSRVLPHAISVDAPSFPTRAGPLVLDTASVVAEALLRMAHRADCRAFLNRLDRVVIVMGPKADATFNGSTMTISVAPGKGFAGRPSSDRLIKAALHR